MQRGHTQSPLPPTHTPRPSEAALHLIEFWEQGRGQQAAGLTCSAAAWGGAVATVWRGPACSVTPSLDRRGCPGRTRCSESVSFTGTQQAHEGHLRGGSAAAGVGGRGLAGANGRVSHGGDYALYIRSSPRIRNMVGVWPPSRPRSHAQLVCTLRPLVPHVTIPFFFALETCVQSYLASAGRTVVYRNVDEDDDVAVTGVAPLAPPKVSLNPATLGLPAPADGAASSALPVGTLVVAVGGPAASFVLAAWPEGGGGRGAAVGTVGAAEVHVLGGGAGAAAGDGGAPTHTPSVLVCVRGDDEGTAGLWAASLLGALAPTRWVGCGGTWPCCMSFARQRVERTCASVKSTAPCDLCVAVHQRCGYRDGGPQRPAVRRGQGGRGHAPSLPLGRERGECTGLHVR
jgi:hypothetical protein